MYAGTGNSCNSVAVVMGICLLEVFLGAGIFLGERGSYDLKENVRNKCLLEGYLYHCLQIQ